ncbi:MAG: 50S ribosomal protein L21 [Actinomycetota bacterium]
MYAVIKTGGKQQKVKTGDVIEVEHLTTEGETVTFRPILVVDDEGKTHFGKDAEKAVVTAKTLGDQKGEKIRVFRYKPKTGSAKRQGHRQLMTLLEISEVSLGAKKPATKKTAAATAEAEVEAAPAEAEAAPAEAD